MKAAVLKQANQLRDFAGELDAIREQIKRMRDERLTVERAPLPRAEAIANLERELATLNNSFKPEIGSFLYGEGTVAAVFVGKDRGAELKIGPALLAWLAGPALGEKLKAEINRFYATEPLALSPAERAARLAAIDTKILGFEFEEEDLIAEAESLGLELDRRLDANPAVVLNVIDRPGSGK